MKRITYMILLSCSLLLGVNTLCLAEVAVIMKASVTESADINDIQKIFLGKSKSLPSGYKVTPVALAEGHPIRELFNDKVLEKSDSQLKSYWAKLIFTGKGRPPKELPSDEEVIAEVNADPSVMGYIDAQNVTADVKVLLKF